MGRVFTLGQASTVEHQPEDDPPSSFEATIFQVGPRWVGYIEGLPKVRAMSRSREGIMARLQEHLAEHISHELKKPRQEKRAPRKQHFLVAGCLAAIALSVGSMFWSGGETELRLDLSPTRALGELIGNETGKLLPSKGPVLLVLPVPASKHDGRVATFRKAFVDTIEHAKGCERIVVEEVCQDQLKLENPVTAGLYGAMLGASGSRNPSFLTSEIVKGMLKRHPNTVAVVSMLDAPLMEDGEWKKLKAQGVATFVYSHGGSRLQELLQKKFIACAFVPTYQGQEHNFVQKTTIFRNDTAAAVPE